jgi:hypothetical protein
LEWKLASLRRVAERADLSRPTTSRCMPRGMAENMRRRPRIFEGCSLVARTGGVLRVGWVPTSQKSEADSRASFLIEAFLTYAGVVVASDRPMHHARCRGCRRMVGGTGVELIKLLASDTRWTSGLLGMSGSVDGNPWSVASYRTGICSGAREAYIDRAEREDRPLFIAVQGYAGLRMVLTGCG